MIRVFNLYVPSSKLLLVLGDALLLATGCFLLFRPLAPTDMLADAQLYVLVLLAAMIGIWSFYFSDLYEHATMRSRQTVLVAGLRGLGVSALLLSPLVWLLAGDRRVGDHFIEPALALILILLYTQRRLSDWWQRRMSSGERVLLVGSGTTVQLLAEQLAGKCGLPLKLAGVVLDHSRPLPKDFRFAVVGTVDRLRELARSFRPDRIVISSEIGISTVSADDLLALRRIGIRVQDAGELYESVTGRVPVESVRSNGLAFGAALIPTAMYAFDPSRRKLFVCCRFGHSGGADRTAGRHCREAGIERAGLLYAGAGWFERAHISRDQVSLHAPGCRERLRTGMGHHERFARDPRGSGAAESASG